MTDQTPKITVAVHFLGQPKPSIFHAEGVFADEAFVVIYTSNPGFDDFHNRLANTQININKDVIERYVSMPYDPELTPTEEPESDANAAERDILDEAIARANEAARDIINEDDGYSKHEGDGLERL